MSKQTTRRWWQRVMLATGTIAIAVGTWSQPGFAGDPFRTEAPRPIDDATETAFRAIFERGDYVAAATALEEASEAEPMAYAMLASFAFLDGDFEGLATYGTQTREVAEALIAEDPLRGNLYAAVGHVLEGAAAFVRDGAVSGTPAIFSKLPLVFSHLDRAEAIDANDPELNLVRGYLDLMLSVNLPFSDPEKAIARLENYAAPAYVSQRGIAVGQRDLGNVAEALVAVDRALELAPENPELMYLKAQIFVKQGDNAGSLVWFQQALALEDQLPQQLANQIAYEGCRAERRVNDVGQSCSPLLDRVDEDRVDEDQVDEEAL